MAEAYFAKITFRQVKALATTELQDDRLADSLDKILGAILLMCPVALGPAGYSALGLLGAKNELVKIGRSAIKKFSQSPKRDFLSRGKNLAAAHCLLTFTAYFEALDRHLPEFVERIELTDVDRRNIIQRTTSQLANERETAQQVHLDFSEMAIDLPHPAASKAVERAQRLQLFNLMTKQFEEFIGGLAAWEELANTQRREISSCLRKLPKAASDIYDMQVITLASDVPQFLAWSSFREHERTQLITESTSANTRKQLDLVIQAVNSIDIGMMKLANAISSLPSASGTDHGANKVADALARAYNSRISEPVIDDKYDSSSDQARLSYPTKIEAFVPQAFKAVRYVNQLMRLENDAEWANVGTREDLGTFVIDYLQSAYSAEAPLLVLGQPGSGKSLFTEILAARLQQPQFNTVRVELRDIDADADIQSQIELQIRKETGHDIGWPAYSEAFPESPPVIVLDGYDELLQSSGKVYATYLDSVQRFQRRESIQGRPVRVIITSRIALIDKALLPIGATVIRLLEFDTKRRCIWVDIWNRFNRKYFSATGVFPFEIGEDTNILQLASQPLLLLMLAVYDSQGNKLRVSRGLDRTQLYHSLLCRFMERERLKGNQGGFRTLSKEAQDRLIDGDLERLGVAAIGMFNREALHITRKQLDHDIAYFKLSRGEGHGPGQRLSEADLLLGGFFFIHESKTIASGQDVRGPSSLAFEFLHNTFGEFLIADFILRLLIKETSTVGKLSDDVELHSALTQRLLQLTDQWFACLSYTAIHTRPNVVAMLSEWALRQLNQSGRPVDEFLRDLDKILNAQLGAILNGVPPTGISTRDGDRPFDHRPVLAQVATYSLNLIVLRTVLCKEGYDFVEDRFISNHSSCRSWDRLVHIWKSWHALEALSGLSTVVMATRTSPSVVSLRRSTAPAGPVRGSRLDEVFHVGLTLADNITAGLAGLMRYESNRIGIEDPHLVSELLRSEGLGDDGEIFYRGLFTGHTSMGANEQAIQVAVNRSIPNLSLTRLRVFELFGRGDLVSVGDLANLNLSRIMPDDAREILALSRVEANFVVTAKAFLEPRWIDHLITQIVDLRLDVDYLLKAPATATVLREACMRHGSEASNALTEHITRNQTSEQARADVQMFDFETAAYCLLLGARTDVRSLVEMSVSCISKMISQRQWGLADLSHHAALILLESIGLSAELREVCSAFVNPIALEVMRRISGRNYVDVYATQRILLRLALAVTDAQSRVYLTRNVVRRIRSYYGQGAPNAIDIVLLLRLARESDDAGILTAFSRYWRGGDIDRKVTANIHFLEMTRGILARSTTVRLFGDAHNDLAWAEQELLADNERLRNRAL